MKHRLLRRIFLIFSLSAVYSSWFGEAFPADDSIGRTLAESLNGLIEEGYLAGAVEYSDDGVWGYINFEGDSSGGGFESGQIDFYGEKITGGAKFIYLGTSAELVINCRLAGDSLSGAGVLAGDMLRAALFLGSGPLESGYKLIVNVNLDTLVLTGSLDRMKPGISRLLHETKELSDALGFIGIDLKVKGDSCVTVKTLDFEGACSLAFNSRPQGDLWGTVSAVRGRIWRWGKPFKLNFAEYDFATDMLVAEGEYLAKTYVTEADSGTVLQPYRVTVTCHGLIEDSLTWEMWSEPELNNEQIVSLLIRGDPHSQEVGWRSGAKLEERVKTAINGYNSHHFTESAERRVGRMLSFNRVEIEGTVFSFDSRYVADKRLTERLKLSLRGTVGGTTEQILSFDYRLGKNTYLTNETNQYGETGIDLRYVFRFK